jgi:hypothetical protein
MLDFIWNIFQHRQIGQLNDSLANNLEKNKYQDNKINSTAARFHGNVDTAEGTHWSNRVRASQVC